MRTIGATKVVPLRMKPGDRERINRTRRVLEQDIARLERSLAQRRSKEGQEATRATILSKRAQLHRLNDYLKVAAPHQVQRRVKPIPKSHVPRDVAPKGSALHQKQMREARRMMRKMDKARKQLAQQAAQPLNLKQAPKVVDEKSLQKYMEVMESNKQAIHEMQMKMAAMERQKKLERETKPKVVEVAKAPALTPMEQKEMEELPKQLEHIRLRYSDVNRVVKRMNVDGYMRRALVMFNKTRDKRYADEFNKRNISLKIATEVTPTPQPVKVKGWGREWTMQKLTHPDMVNIPQKMQSIRNRIAALNKKKAGLGDIHHYTPAPRKSSGFMDRIAADGAKATHMEQLGTIQHHRSLMGVPNPHRPYAMGRNLGMLTVLKQRELQRNNRPKIEANNMAGLRRYTNAQHARESRVRAEQESKKEVANLAGAFTQTRAVMERMVR
jgi:hypothetical protein